MRPRAVVLDVGGVLERCPRTGWEERWAARLGLGRAEFEARLRPLLAAGDVGAVTLPELERAVAVELSLDDEALGRLMEDRWVEYLGTLDAELAAWFAALRPRWRTGILSNSFVGAREREQAAYGLPALCDVCVYSHEVGVVKPDRAAYAIVCERLGVSPDEAIFVDDVPANVEGARAAGMAAVRFTDTRSAIIEVERWLAG